MKTPALSDLPVYEVLPKIARALSTRDELVLQAPPGAGKTTAVPLALLAEPWLSGQRILILEPRRVAARAAAARMAQLLDEKVGDTIGYRVRLDSCVSAQTRIEVITEGILTRRLQDDPELAGVGLVIFDEFHERALDADLSLALLLQGRETFRNHSPLKILVMSATLDGDAVSALLDDAPIITARGQQFPVTVSYSEPHALHDSITAPVVMAIRRALSERPGNLLVFLPGQAEIRAVARSLAEQLPAEVSANVQVTPLYGALPLSRQQRALAPLPPGQRKIVLATNIAETSLTIDGVAAVIDSGLVREGIFDPVTGTTRLETRRISRASATQRQGRAGRLAPGHCYRIGSREQYERLVAQNTPAIQQADLTGLALQLLDWGVTDTRDLCWLDPPPSALWSKALSTLADCGATRINPGGQLQLTAHGRQLARLPVHPRVAHMLVSACRMNVRRVGCLLAAVLVERLPDDVQGADITAVLALLQSKRSCPARLQAWFARVQKQAARYEQLLAHIAAVDTEPAPADHLPGLLLASAWPEHIARLRPGAARNEYQLSNGRSAWLPDTDALAGTAWLAVAQLGGSRDAASDRIYSAAALDEAHLDTLLARFVKERERVEWDYQQEQLQAQRRRYLGALVLSAAPAKQVPAQVRITVLADVLRKKGLNILPWTTELEQWRARVMLLRQHLGADDWPDFSDETLLATIERWLSPFLDGVARLADFKAVDLKSALSAQLPWPLPQQLDELTPQRITVPSGSHIAIDYCQSTPVLAVKLQEMFGCDQTPSIVNGRVPLLVHLLSPAGRPLQVTQDLAGFWRGGYEQVRREMRGRYPRHPWPADPVGATATRHTRRRLEQSE